MESLIALWTQFQAITPDILDAIAYLVMAASVIVKLTPTLKDDNILKGVIKFIGKWVALDKYGPKG